MVLLIAALAVVLAVSASATLVSPNYYGVEKVEEGSITIDGAVDEAYGAPIFSFVADGTDVPAILTATLTGSLRAINRAVRTSLP